jgi:hypothetical protein
VAAMKGVTQTHRCRVLRPRGAQEKWRRENWQLNKEQLKLEKERIPTSGPRIILLKNMTLPIPEFYQICDVIPIPEFYQICDVLPIPEFYQM